MPPIATNSEVFEFCGTAADVQTTQGTAITNLIANVQDEVENMLGRNIVATAFTSVLFQDGLNCEICKEKLFLKGPYRDIYTLSAITEAGVSLTAVADYNDSGDYYLDSKLGILTRNYSYWSELPFAVKMTGSMGIGSYAAPTFTPKKDIKQSVIEIVAIKAGLWKKTIQTEGGNLEVERSFTKRLDALKKYILRDPG